MLTRIAVRAGLIIFMAAVICSRISAAAQAPASAPAQTSTHGARDLFVTIGKSLIVESPVIIQRVAVGNAKIAEAVAATPKEVLINGLTVGETSLIIWQQTGNRLIFDLAVQASTTRLELMREELRKELPGQDISLELENGNAFLRGTVDDPVSAERAITIARTLGRPVNLLNVKVPASEQQILLRVRFANVDRTAATELGANLFSLGGANTVGRTSTEQFNPPNITMDQQGIKATFTDLLNIFLFRPDLNIGATIRALQNRRLLEILAEPNLLAIHGRDASFLAGGEFPVPVIQSSAGAGAVTIQWREFGIRLNFTPTVTPRGTIRLRVMPEVSSLDFTNAVTISGFTVPALSTRRVQTEIELETGQSFAIAGLLDNRVIENWNKVPGLADVPVIGKLFRSRVLSKTNTELLVVVTPELVRPLMAGQPTPNLTMPQPFMKEAPTTVPRHPGVPGGVETKPRATMPYESWQAFQRQQAQQGGQPAAPQVQWLPMMPVQVPPAAQPGGNAAAGAGEAPQQAPAQQAPAQAPPANEER